METRMTNSLKTCPFCGGEMVIIEMISNWNRYGIQKQYYACCSECCARTQDRPTPKEALALWNTRKPMDRIVEQLERISPEPTTKCYAHEDEYTAAFEMYEKCMAIVKGEQK